MLGVQAEVMQYIITLSAWNVKEEQSDFYDEPDSVYLSKDTSVVVLIHSLIGKESRYISLFIDLEVSNVVRKKKPV